MKLYSRWDAISFAFSTSIMLGSIVFFAASSPMNDGFMLAWLVLSTSLTVRSVRWHHRGDEGFAMIGGRIVRDR